MHNVAPVSGAVTQQVCIRTKLTVFVGPTLKSIMIKITTVIHLYTTLVHPHCSRYLLFSLSQ